jgi:capsular polysaccharide biosynthesis protein
VTDDATRPHGVQVTALGAVPRDASGQTPSPPWEFPEGGPASGPEDAAGDVARTADDDAGDLSAVFRQELDEESGEPFDQDPGDEREAGFEAAADLAEPPLRPIGALVSFHYLRAAVRRHRALVIGGALAGMLAGAAFLSVAPASHTARIAILLSHAAGDDPNRSMATDVALLESRTVADRTVEALQLTTTPEQLTTSVAVLPSTSDMLELTIEAPSGAEAVRRLTAFTTTYLAFRATQVSAQTDFMIKGYSARIALLQAQLADLDQRIARLAAGTGTTDQLSDAVAQRSQVAAQASTVQDSLDDATLRRTAMVSASRIIDPARALPSGGPRRVALAVASGLIGGTGLALAVIVLRALLSDRLRLRVEVTSAVEAPILVSTGRLAPPGPLGRLHRVLPRGAGRERRRCADLRRAGQALSRAVAGPAGPPRLVVACVDNAAEAAFAVVEATEVLRASGRTVELTDLTEAAALQRLVRDAPPAEARHDAPIHHLVLADLDPAIGTDHYAEWGERVVVVVTAGRSGVVRLRTTGDLVRSAGLDLHGVVLLRAEPGDESSGTSQLAPGTGAASGAAVIAIDAAGPGSAAIGGAGRSEAGPVASPAARRFS